MTNILVLYLVPAKDWAGVERDTVAIDDPRLDRLIECVMEKRPGLAKRRDALRFAVNEELVSGSVSLADGDEVAFIPPVSGGTDEHLVRLVDAPIDAEAVRRHVDAGGQAGAVATFEGLTRSETHPEHGRLLRLEYEAYGGMATKQLRRLADDAGEKWGVTRLAIVHRTGPVGLGEASVMIAVACPHRAEAFEACRWLIDSLKKDVTIWKREIWESGVSSWVDPTNVDG